MNPRGIKRKLRTLFQRKSSISQPGRLIAHLINEIGISGKYRPQLEQALESMAEDGEIELEKAGVVYNAVHYLGPVEDEIDPTSEDDEFASIVSQSALASPIREMTELEALIEDLNYALIALRSKINNKSGIVTKPVTEILREHLECDESRACELDFHLTLLGLMSTLDSELIHGVRIDDKIEVVTEALWRRDTPLDESSQSPVDDTPACVTAKLGDPVTQLTSIVEHLAEELRNKQQGCEQCAARRRQLASENSESIRRGHEPQTMLKERVYVGHQIAVLV